MIWFIVFGVIISFILKTIYSYLPKEKKQEWIHKDDEYGPEGNWEYFYNTLFVLMGGIWLWLSLFTPIALSTQFDTETNTKVKKLVTLQDSTATSGSGSFLAFSITEEPTYYYYVKNKNYYKLKSMKAKKVKVIQKESLSRGLLIEIDTDFKRWYPYLVAFDLFYHGKYFVVPQGSIVKKFNLDTKGGR